MLTFITLFTIKSVDSKKGQTAEKAFLGTISVSYQNQNYLSKCTTNHRNFGAEVKMRVIHTSKINNFAFMVWVKIFHF